jgi:hypothetical protein
VQRLVNCCTIYPDGLHASTTRFGYLCMMLNWRRLILLRYAILAGMAAMSIDSSVAWAQPGKVLQPEDLAHQRPANFFKLRYARSADICREYGQSIAGPATPYPFPHVPVGINYGGPAGDAVSRSTLEIPALATDPDNFAKDVPTWFRERGPYGLPVFFHVDFDNTGRVGLAMIWNIPMEGRHLLLPKASLRDRAYQPDDPAILSATEILPNYPQLQPGFNGWEESEALTRSIEAAIGQPLPRFTGPDRLIPRYYWFARVAGRTYLMNTLWLAEERRTDVFSLLIELRPDGEGVLMCGFSNAVPVAGCSRDLPRGTACWH